MARRRSETDNGGAPRRASGATLDVSEDRVATRAYEKWLARGCPHGDDLRDWFEALDELTRDQKGSGRSADKAS